MICFPLKKKKKLYIKKFHCNFHEFNNVMTSLNSDSYGIYKIFLFRPSSFHHQSASINSRGCSLFFQSFLTLSYIFCLFFCLFPTRQYFFIRIYKENKINSTLLIFFFTNMRSSGSEYV